jgi:hypothetical protein
MNKKIREEIKEEEKIEIPQQDKGRQEEDYFFPKERVTIKASSLNEALKKLKELK